MFRCAPQNTTSYYLTSIVQLTTMDFHLTKLNCLLRDLESEVVVSIGEQQHVTAQEDHGDMVSREIGSLLQNIKRMKDDMKYAIEALHI